MCLACLPRQAPQLPAVPAAQPEESKAASGAPDGEQQSTTVVELYDDNMDADLQVGIIFESLMTLVFAAICSKLLPEPYICSP